MKYLIPQLPIFTQFILKSKKNNDVALHPPPPISAFNLLNLPHADYVLRSDD